LAFLWLDLDGADTPSQQQLVRHFLANALSDVIVNGWEPAILAKILREHYGCFNEDERATIMGYARERLSPGGNHFKRRISRKGHILRRLTEYLQRNDQVVVEGFLAFRLKDYMQELEDAVDQAVDDFVLEREYCEFIDLLKIFAHSQEPKIEEVHVLFTSSGAFHLLDAQGYPLDHDYLDDFVVDMVDSGVDYQDLLISALITLSPEHIVVHGTGSPDDLETLDTLGEVFGPRLHLNRDPWPPPGPERDERRQRGRPELE